MAISCGDPKRLLDVIRSLYPNAVITGPNAIGTYKVVFPDGLVVNVFANGTVGFQGKDSPIKEEISRQVEIINRE
ncbi:hypothetical protein ABRZ04_04425 [Castellaniella ginsengisoli]|uniref:Uncharacterized protein n=1 Tax=Castellaniella ginsengisoli TaxID=546114 RepID=A0AB39D2H0_9BURK